MASLFLFYFPFSSHLMTITCILYWLQTCKWLFILKHKIYQTGNEDFIQNNIMGCATSHDEKRQKEVCLFFVNFFL